MKEFYSVADILAENCPALPREKRNLNRFIEDRGWRNDTQRARQVSGNGRDGRMWEYHYSLFPAELQAKLLAASLPAQDPSASARANSLWTAFDAMPESRKEEARHRLARVTDVNNLAQCMSKHAAVAFVAKEAGIATSTLWGWLKTAASVAKSDRLAALAPRHVGRTATSDCDPRAWQALVADYMRPEQPAFSACYRRLEDAAIKNGWSPIPSSKTLQRRIERDVPRGARVLARKGLEAAKATFPHQTRDRTVFTAMQAINADGHRFDVFTKWPDGTVSRPVMIAVQDVYSGMFLAHSIDQTENKGGVRKALADMIESFGIPEHAFFDNGRQFASKWITGGTPNRFRFKVRDDEPTGLLTQLGVQIHWTTPYHGQAKPIERAFRDLCEEIAKHPKCAGAYTGNKPDAKPENYASKAVPIEQFSELVAAEIARHNSRSGRRSAVAQGRSLAETFRASFTAPSTLVRRASEAQRRLFLTPAEGVTARKPTGEVQLGGNRYWAEPMVEHAGRKLVVRFEPSNLLQPVSIYTLDGRFICEAECVEAAGFNDIDAARSHARKKSQFLKLQREALAIERTMTIDQVAALLPNAAPIDIPQPTTIRIVPTRNGSAAAAFAEPDEVWAGTENFARAMAMREADRADVLPFPRKEESGLG